MVDVDKYADNRVVNSVASRNVQGTATGVQQLARHNPSEALSYLPTIRNGFTEPDVQERRAAVKTVVSLSAIYPYEVRDTVTALLTRLDDVDANVRVNTIIAVSNLAKWYPQDFGGTADLLNQSLDVDNEYEVAAAGAALVEIGRQRPDLVTPREEVLSRLKEIQQGQRLECPPDGAPDVDYDKLQEAVEALEGGDLASRPLEEDLSPVGRRTPLSSPARVGIIAALWFPLIIISVGIFCARLIQEVTAEEQYKKKKNEPVKHLKFFISFHRARLYLRQSTYPTPAQIMPLLPGTAPEPPKPDEDAPAKPPEWNEITAAVWERDDCQCRNCQKEVGASKEGDAYIDMKTPAENGGAYEPPNLRTLCFDCQQARYGVVLSG